MVSYTKKVYIKNIPQHAYMPMYVHWALLPLNMCGKDVHRISAATETTKLETSTQLRDHVQVYVITYRQLYITYNNPAYNVFSY